jgi:S-methylmethionine-dependent homocysteine/selenocysteine methylase
MGPPTHRYDRTMPTPQTAPLLIDGGMGRELKYRGVRVPNTIWSAAALVEAPGEVTRLHGDFLDSGAEVIITNNYAAVPTLLSLEGMEPDLERLIGVAVACATDARHARSSTARIAGSMPPLDQTYRPDLVHPLDDNLRDYRRIVSAFADRADLFICETMSTVDEARAAATAALESGREVWASFTLADDDSGNLRDGTSPRAAVDAMVDLGIDTVLFNCCRPEAITAALRRIEGHEASRVGGYPNAMEAVPDGWALGSNSQIEIRQARDALLLDHIDEWRELGVAIVGGCCGIGPGTIASVREYLDG